MVYHFSKNKSLYFNDLRFGLLNDSSENPQFAFSYEFITESELKAVEVPKNKRDGKRLLLRIATKRKLTGLLILYFLAVIIV
jgi:inner membrane protein